MCDSNCEKEQSYSESNQKLFISHTITAFLRGGLVVVVVLVCVCVCVCVCVWGGGVVVVKSKPLLCMCGVGGMDILWVFFETHYFLIK